MSQFAAGDKVWVLPGPVTYPGGVRDTIDETHKGVILGPDLEMGDKWYAVDIPACQLPQGTNRWLVHADYLRPRRDDPPPQRELSSWNHSFWCMVGWNPAKVTA